MNESKEISKSEMILLSVYDNWTESEFTAEDLVVACWKKYPDAFGLQGYPDKYPDSNIIYRYIMGKDSIVKKSRWLSQKDQKRYVLTIAGINHAIKILGHEGYKVEAQRQKIDRYYEQVLLRIFTGAAWAKFVSGRMNELTFTDACGFWSINPRSSGEQFRSAKRELSEAIASAKRSLNTTDAKVALSSKLVICRKDIERLELLNEELQEKFKNQLDLINSRSMKWGKVK